MEYRRREGYTGERKRVQEKGRKYRRREWNTGEEKGIQEKGR